VAIRCIPVQSQHEKKVLVSTPVIPTSMVKDQNDQFSRGRYRPSHD